MNSRTGRTAAGPVLTSMPGASARHRERGRKQLGQTSNGSPARFITPGVVGLPGEAPRYGHDFAQLRVHHHGSLGQAATAPNGGGGPDGSHFGSARIRRPIEHDSAFEREADAIGLRGLSAPPNEQAVRQKIGDFLGFDFSHIRLHRDVKADISNAHAVTQGADVYLAPGRFRPDLPLGRVLLAHEFSHVAQQRAVPRLPYRSGRFREAVKGFGQEHSSMSLAERARTLEDETPQLTAAPLGMRQRCITSCKNCSGEHDEGDAAPPAPSQTAPNPPSKPQPTHAVGPAEADAGNKIVRLSWTVDDGPTPFTPGMSTVLSPRAATWFIMNNQLGTGKTRADSMTQLSNRQKAGDEIAIHSMHPTVAHSAWFPINLGISVKKGYETTEKAMEDLKSFTGELRGSGLQVHFARMPGGEISEVRKYIEAKGGSSGSSDEVAKALLSGSTPKTPAPAKVAEDVTLVMKTLKSLNLHLWGGSESGPEVTAQTWEAESSGVPERTDDVVRRFTGVVDRLANGSRKRPGSFVILAHDTTDADVKKAKENISAMEKYATDKSVRVEYYRMGDLYQILRNTPP